MRDIGFIYTPDDANRAQDLLDEIRKVRRYHACIKWIEPIICERI